MTTFSIGTQPNPNDRRQVEVGQEDALCVRRLMGSQVPDATVIVFDYARKEYVTLRRADCGLGCRCALDFAQAARV